MPVVIPSNELTLLPGTPAGESRIIHPSDLSFIEDPTRGVPWKTSYDVPGGNGRIAETPIMDQRKAIDVIMKLGRQWGQLMPELADVDPEMPGIGGVVIEGEHIQGPPRMLGATVHGDCADLLCNSAAIYEARGQLKQRKDGTWESPMGIATLFENPDAPQDHVAWSEYDHMAMRPRQLGGWFDVVKNLVKKAAPSAIRTVTSMVAPWATPLISPAWKLAKKAAGKVWRGMQAGPRQEARVPRQMPGGWPSGGWAPQQPPRGYAPPRQRSIRPPFASDERMPYTRQLPMSYRVHSMPKKPWARFPTRPSRQGRPPLYLPPQVSQGWDGFRF